ncbi:hypothetical protein PMIN06_010143 [Paraphaeosphaeria minitans]
MRSTIIIATCALVIFAAPIPEAEPIYKSNGRSVSGFGNGAAVDARGAIEDESNKRASVIRPGQDWKRAEEDVEAVEARAIRNQTGKRAEDQDEEDEESVKARAIRNQTNKRAVEDDEDDKNIEARAIKNESNKRPVREKTSFDDDVEARNVGNEYRSAEAERISRNTGSYRRDAEADPISRNTGSYRRDAEAEPGFTRAKPDHRREAEAEPLNRINGKKRTAEPTIRGPRTGSQKRDASP